MNTNQINGIVRGVTSAGGGAAMIAGSDDLIRILGAVVTLISIIWSVVEKHRSSSGNPPPPPTATAAFLLTGILLGASGCTTMTPAQKANLVSTVSAEAAYVGTAYDLQANPSHRPAYVTAVAALDALVARADYDPEHLRAALTGLPALRGGTGALVDGGVVLYTVASGFLDLNSAPYVKLAILGIRDGITRALARPTGPATSALARPLPPQCVVPQR